MGGQQTERLLRIAVETTAVRNTGGDALKDAVLQFLGVFHHASDDVIDRLMTDIRHNPPKPKKSAIEVDPTDTEVN